MAPGTVTRSHQRTRFDVKSPSGRSRSLPVEGQEPSGRDITEGVRQCLGLLDTGPTDTVFVVGESGRGDGLVCER